MAGRLVASLAAALVLASAAIAPARAGSPYNDGGPQAGQRGAAAARPAGRGPSGLFSCSFREQRTKLERKNCGGVRS